MEDLCCLVLLLLKIFFLRVDIGEVIILGNDELAVNNDDVDGDLSLVVDCGFRICNASRKESASSTSIRATSFSSVCLFTSRSSYSPRRYACCRQGAVVLAYNSAIISGQLSGGDDADATTCSSKTSRCAISIR